MSDFNGSGESSTQEPQDQKKKLTDMQLRIVQFAAGILCAAALVISMFFMPELAKTNDLLQYLFLVIFLIIMFGRRWVENKFRLRVNLFSLVLIDGILGGILIFVLVTPAMALGPVWTPVILIGGTVLLLAFGIGWPLMRYFKRKEKGTLPPIRIPEKKEDAADAPKEAGPTTVEQKIAEMMRELDEKNDNGQK